MKCVSGLVSQARHGWEWAGDGGVFWRTTDLKLGAQDVHLYPGRHSEVSDGDRLVVAGTVRNATLRVLAYKNLSTGAQGNSGWVSSLILGVFFLGLALGTASVVVLFSVFAGALAAYFLLHAYRTRAAMRVLKDAA
jgi:hypothetical protein